MKRFGAHFLGREHRPGEVLAWAFPKLPSSGPQPKARHPKVRKSSWLVGVPAQSLGAGTPSRSWVSDLHRQRLVHLQPHVLNTAKDLLLVARQGDPNPEQISVDGVRAGSVPSLLPATLGPTQSSLSCPSKSEVHLLRSHLSHQVKGCKPRTDEALLVAPHLDGVQPVTDCREGGVIWDCAVQEGL